MVVVQSMAGILFVAGLSYLILAIYRVASWPMAIKPSDFLPPVTVLVPAHGAPPTLDACLRSICRQDYPAFQVVFGLQRADDPAQPVIERLMAELPGQALDLVVDPRPAGANPKNSNLANMAPVARHDILVVVDSDVMVGPAFLAAIVGPLAEPTVGCTTCPYTGLPAAGWAARLGALYINDWFFPSALVDSARRELDITYGAASALRRRALRQMGGFEAMASAVAQDAVLGREVSRAGWRVVLVPYPVATVVDEPGLGPLLSRELRWNRTLRAVRPRDHLLSIVTSPLLPFLLLALPSWPAAATAAAAAALVAGRMALHLVLRRRVPLPRPEPWWLPLREAINAGVWAVALMGRRIRWGETVLRTGEGLTMRIEQGGRR